MMNEDTQNKETLLLALDCWNKQAWDVSIRLLKSLVDASYLPAFPEYLWRIWSDGYYIQEFNEILEKGIRLGSKDCEYIKVWKEFANRPATQEYWDVIINLAENHRQKNALLALGLHKYLCYSNREEGIAMMCESYGCRASLENLSMVYHYGYQSERELLKKLLTEEQLKKVINTLSVPIEPHHYKFRTPFRAAFMVNSKLTNDYFNGTVFTALRHEERKRIAKGIAPTFSDIKETILSNLPGDVKVIEGLSKNSWSFTSQEQYDKEFERHSLYLTKQLEDGKWMTLRIGDHTPNTGDYYKYRRMYEPSAQDNANLCIMLHGDREQEAGLSYSFRFRPETSDPCITVRDEDFQCYQPFYYTIAHFIPGLIDDNGKKLSDEINKWFDASCKKQFYPVYTEKESSFMACARIQAGWTNVETWDMKYARRRAPRQEIKRTYFHDNKFVIEDDELNNNEYTTFYIKDDETKNIRVFQKVLRWFGMTEEEINKEIERKS